MTEKQDRDKPRLSQIETVRCLSCGAAYSKPSSGGTVRANPGCPDCGYVGWVRTSTLTRLEPRRFSEDRPRSLSA
jgi:predicted  nucleic acid-binding Zn-ribbon protein